MLYASFYFKTFSGPKGQYITQKSKFPKLVNNFQMVVRIIFRSLIKIDLKRKIRPEWVNNFWIQIFITLLIINSLNKS